MNIDITAALLDLRPNSSFSVIGNEYSGIKWHSKDSIVPTEEEVNNKITELKAAEPHKLLREERNKRLTACDWIVTKYAEYGHNIPKEWRTYRQALRDLPSISYQPELDENGRLNMDSVAWPTPPE